MESKTIALALDKEYPHPLAYLDSPVLKQVQEARTATLAPLFPMLVPRMPQYCLSGPNIEYTIEARKRTLGMTLEEYEAKDGGEPAWEEAMPGLRQLAAILRKDPSGAFCLGSTPCDADFFIVAWPEWCRCLQRGIFERIVGIDAAFQDRYDACRLWLERNDY